MESWTLNSDGCRIRPIDARDIGPIQQLAGAAEIAENTFVPHPYPPDAASEFVKLCQERWALDEAYVFAIIDIGMDAFVGTIGIHLDATHNCADVGYWIGKPYWGRGLATAALRLVIKFGFEKLHLNRIEAGHFSENPASGRVMEKASMRYEGVRRQSALHRESYKDVVYFSILREDYLRDGRNNASGREKTAED